MTLRLLLLLLAAVVCVALVLAAREDPGYLMVRLGPWVVESSLALGGLLLLLAFTLFHYLLRLGDGLCRLPGRLDHRRRRRRSDKSRARLIKGLAQLWEGRPAEAVATLEGSAAGSDSPALHHLTAALAARRAGEAEERDRLLHQALESGELPELATGLLLAEWRLAEGRNEQALAGLLALGERHPNHPRRRLLEAEALLRLKDWPALLEHLPKLRKQLLVSELSRFEEAAHRGLLERADDVEGLLEAWERLPERLKREPEWVADQAERLLAHHRQAEAEALIRAAIAQGWDDRLARLYGEVELDDPAAQLGRAEAWQAGRERNPDLLLTLGRLSHRNRLWGKARAYLEASLGARPEPLTCHHLATTLDAMGEAAAAAECRKRGLEMAATVRAQAAR